MSRLNKAVSFGIVLLVAVMVNVSCNGGTAKVEEQKPQIVLRSYDEARAYVSQCLDKAIPADYKAPDYIYSQLSKDQKYEEFGRRYPQFYGLGSTDLLDSVIAYPHLYETMIIENRALRASVTQ
jgi:hypothetical protein